MCDILIFYFSSIEPLLIRTNRTEVVVVELEKNRNYMVRISAETDGGRGEFSEPQVLKIFNKTPGPDDGTSTHGPPNNTTHGFVESSQRHLGN